MALTMGSFPVRDKLPVKYSTEIGRIITRWSMIEWHLKRLAYDVLKTDPKSGRVAVREPRVGEYITMIEDLLSIRGIKTEIDWKGIKKELEDIESFRNKIAHGIWVTHHRTKNPILQETKGKHPGEKDATQKKARVNPKALNITLNNLQDYRRRVDAANHHLRLIRDGLYSELKT